MSRAARNACLWFVTSLVVGAATPCAGGSAARRSPSSATQARFDAYLEPLLADQQISGNLLVARNGVVLYERSLGYASYELGVRNGADTVFAVASITKPMTYAIATQLAAEGALHLDDRLSRWLPELPRADAITVRHLLEHKSGIPHRVTTEEEEAVPHSAADMVRLVARKPLRFEPGTKAEYSSAGYSVLARVLELASGHSYRDLLQSRVFDRAGMAHSYQPGDSRVVPNLAASYMASWKGVRLAPLKDLTFLVGAGSVLSTARDLLRFVDAIRDGRLGSAVRASPLVDRDVLSWQGSTNGYRSLISADRRTGITVVFTGNLRSGAVEKLASDLPRLAAGDPVPTPARLDLHPIALTESARRQIEGVYSVLDGEWPAVVDGDLLVLGGWSFVPTGDRTFFSIGDYGELKATTDESGRVTGFDWTSKGTTLRCARLR